MTTKCFCLKYLNNIAMLFFIVICSLFISPCFSLCPNILNYSIIKKKSVYHILSMNILIICQLMF